MKQTTHLVYSFVLLWIQLYYYVFTPLPVSPYLLFESKNYFS